MKCPYRKVILKNITGRKDGNGTFEKIVEEFALCYGEECPAFNSCPGERFNESLNSCGLVIKNGCSINNR